MDDFNLLANGGFPSQDVIVGGDYSLVPDDLSPDISHFVTEEVIFEDIDSGLTSSSDDLSPQSNESVHDEDIVNVRVFENLMSKVVFWGGSLVL